MMENCRCSSAWRVVRMWRSIWQQCVHYLRISLMNAVNTSGSVSEFSLFSRRQSDQSSQRRECQLDTLSSVQTEVLINVEWCEVTVARRLWSITQCREGWRWTYIAAAATVLVVSCRSATQSFIAITHIAAYVKLHVTFSSSCNVTANVLSDTVTCLHAAKQTFAPLINSVVDDTLLQTRPLVKASSANRKCVLGANRLK